MATVIYHNPKCSKSRATLQLLRDEGIEPEVVLYLETPPKADTLRTIVRLLDVKVTDIVRFGEKFAKEADLSAGEDRPESEWLALIEEHPQLLQRPIVVVDDERAAIGRPPEAVKEILP